MPSSYHDNLPWRPSQMADMIYRYSRLNMELGQKAFDYGTGRLYTSVEVHTVTHIRDNPGITAKEIADITRRTKGAVSQLTAKLEEKGLIYTEKDRTDGRKLRLYVTEKGRELDRRHKEFDEQSFGPVLEEMIKKFGFEGVENFVEMLEFGIEKALDELKQL